MSTKAKVLLVLIGVLVLGGICKSDDSTSRTTSSRRQYNASVTHSVQYKVESNASVVDILYTDASGNSQSIVGAATPWIKTITFQEGDEIYLRADGYDVFSSPYVSITVKVDGDVEAIRTCYLDAGRDEYRPNFRCSNHVYYLDYSVGR